MNDKPHSRLPVRALLIVALAVVSAIGAMWLLIGQHTVEKLLTRLAMPVGLVWLILIGICITCFVAKRRRLAVVSLLCLTLLTVSGNEPASVYFARSLEGHLYEIDPMAKGALDRVVVLGGGLEMGPRQRVLLALGGDRVLLAAKLHRSGLAKSIVCTGQVIQSLARDDDLEPAESARSCGNSACPRSVSRRSAAGILSKRCDTCADSLGPDERVGLITSGWHMPRAMRLARAAGLHVEPLPAGFAAGPVYFNLLAPIPTARGLWRTTLIAHEYMARLVSR